MLNPAALLPHIEGFNISQDVLLSVPPSETLLEASRVLQLDPSELMKHLLFSPMDLPVFDGKGRPKLPVTWQPSFTLRHGLRGPQGTHKVMGVLKMPAGGGNTFLNSPSNMVIMSGLMRFLTGAAAELNYDIRDWYFTHACRFVPPDGGKTIKEAYIKDCRCLLAQEIEAIRPDLIFLMGGDAVASFAGKGKMEKMRSNVFLLRGPGSLGKEPIPLTDVNAYERQYGGSRVLVTIHPGAIVREEGLKAGFMRDLERLRDLEAGKVDVAETDQYEYVTHPGPLRELCQRVLAEAYKEVAIDCEWGGKYQTGKLRSIQFAWDALKACSVLFCHDDGREAQRPEERAEMLEILRWFFGQMDIVGHNFREDSKWLSWHGLNMIERLTFDTMLADHALSENAEHGLENLSVRFTTMGRYDYPLSQWLKKNEYDQNKLDEVGYLYVPDAMILKYGCQDVDCTLRAKKKLREELDKPENAQTKWLYDNIIIPCNAPIHEIEMSGLLVDQKLMMEMTWLYEAKRAELVAKLRQQLRRPQFNPNSHLQVKELLFKELGLKPYKTTGKPSQMWAEVENLPLERLNRLSPAVDAETLEYLSVGEPTGVVSTLHDFKIINQMCTNFLVKPRVFNGYEVWDEGLTGFIAPDGRIHTTLSQMSETGRDKSADPNLQNWPKKANSEYDRIMEECTPKIRQCCISAPGHVLVEVDFRGAEIFTLGYLANCPKLVRDAGDLHSRGAVNYFGVEKWEGFDENKKAPGWWKEKYEAQRTAAKTINFGIAYQRGAAAIAREITKTTKGAIKCTKEMAQQFIDGYYNTYPEVRAYVDMCKRFVQNPGRMYNPFGRCRRFDGIDLTDRSFVAGCQRELVAFGIQSTVADALNQARINFYYWRRFNPHLCNYKLLLAIHDACLFEVPGNEAHILVEQVIPECMVYGAEVPSWIPYPGARPTEKFHLDVDIEVGLRWHAPATAEQLTEAGCCEALVKRYAKEEKK